MSDNNKENTVFPASLDFHQPIKTHLKIQNNKNVFIVQSKHNSFLQTVI